MRVPYPPPSEKRGRPGLSDRQTLKQTQVIRAADVVESTEVSGTNTINNICIPFKQ